jgi:hypothetical protein
LGNFGSVFEWLDTKWCCDLAMVKNKMLNEKLRRNKLEITSEHSTLIIKNQGRNTHRNSYDDDKRDKLKRGSKSRKIDHLLLL